MILAEAEEGRTVPVYAYASNNPITRVDPSGLEDCPPGTECIEVIGDPPKPPSVQGEKSFLKDAKAFARESAERFRRNVEDFSDKVKEAMAGGASGSSPYGQARDLKRKVEKVLKGQAGRETLTAEERELAAQLYEEVAGKTTGKFANEAKLYNLERAKYLRGQVDKIAPTLPAFIKNTLGK